MKVAECTVYRLQIVLYWLYGGGARWLARAPSVVVATTQRYLRLQLLGGGAWPCLCCHAYGNSATPVIKNTIDRRSQDRGAAVAKDKIRQGSGSLDMAWIGSSITPFSWSPARPAKAAAHICSCCRGQRRRVPVSSIGAGRWCWCHCHRHARYCPSSKALCIRDRAQRLS
jgi:hypothetical protein